MFLFLPRVVQETADNARLTALAMLKKKDGGMVKRDSKESRTF